MATDFFDRQKHARKQTRLLVWLFGLAVLAVVVLTCLILGTLIQVFLKPLVHAHNLFSFFNDFPFSLRPEKSAHPFSVWELIWNPNLFCWITLGTLTSIALGCLYKFRLLSGGGSAVAEMLGGRKIDGQPTGPDEKKLRDIVEEMAVASEMSVPEIYVLDRERCINSFAAGHTRDDAAIGVTLGAMKLLTRDELQGVIAHEFSHILNGDTRLNMKLMALAHGFFWPTLLGRILVYGSPEAPEIGESIFDNEEGNPIYLPTAPIGILFLFIGTVSLPFVRLIKSAICREREWLADAAAVQFTRNPAGIGGALKKIGGLYKAGRLDTPHAESASHLYFSNSADDPWFGFMSTHPPLTKRILAIDPGFDGQFAHINSLPRPSDHDSQEAKYDHVYEESLRHAREQEKAREELE
jgi:Zn-dependent protease with chaperone function